MKYLKDIRYMSGVEGVFQRLLVPVPQTDVLVVGTARNHRARRIKVECIHAAWSVKNTLSCESKPKEGNKANNNGME